MANKEENVRSGKAQHALSAKLARKRRSFLLNALLSKLRYVVCAVFLFTLMGASQYDCDYEAITLYVVNGWFNRQGNPTTYAVDRGSNASISVTADVPSGYTFDSWTATAGTINSPNSVSTTWSIDNIQDDATITANLILPPPPPPPTTTYVLTVVNGSGSGTYSAGSLASITADDNSGSGRYFFEWIGAPVQDRMSSATTIEVYGNYTVTANYDVAVPKVDAGSDLAIISTSTNCSSGGDLRVSLQGDAIDDRARFPETLSVAWSCVACPAGTVFSHPDDLSTSITFPGGTSGEYQVTLTAEDGIQPVQAQDTAKINACNSSQTPPVITFQQNPMTIRTENPNKTITLTASAQYPGGAPAVDSYRWRGWRSPVEYGNDDDSAASNPYLPQEISWLTNHQTQTAQVMLGSYGTYRFKLDAGASGNLHTGAELTVEVRNQFVELTTAVSSTTNPPTDAGAVSIVPGGTSCGIPSSDCRRFSAGSTVTIYADEASGYGLAGWVVQRTNGNDAIWLDAQQYPFVKRELDDDYKVTAVFMRGDT